MSKEKETETNLKVTLTKVKYDILIKGSRTWKAFDGNAESIRSKFYVIGKGLDVIYTDLKEKGVKRDEIAQIVEKYFPDMTGQNRSDFRKMALNHAEVETYCLEHYKRGFSPSNILYNWTRYKANAEKEEDSTTENDTGSNPSNSDATTGKVTMVTDKGLEVQPHKLKTGLEVENSKVTVYDTKDIAKYFFNNIVNLYNADKYCENTDTMDILRYIHNRSVMLVELTKVSVDGELKKAA